MRQTRRNFLAVLGSTGIATLAGCSGVLDSGNDRPELDVGPLRDVERLGSPAIPARTPAPISQTFLDSSESRAREMLDSVPESMSSSAVPNQAVRRIYADAYEDAVRSLEDARSEKTRFEQVHSLRHARGSGAMVNGTYDAAVGELDVADIRPRVESLRSEVTSFERDHQYVGGELGPALVVHAAVERFVAVASRYLDNTAEAGQYSESAPRVGEMLEALESARASLEAARHLSERYRESLSDPQDFGDVFRQSASSLVAVVEDRRAAYPDGYEPIFEDIDRDVEDAPAHNLLVETFVHMRFGAKNARDALRDDRLATSLLEVHASERNRRALESAETAVKRGNYDAPESARTVRETKLAALEAVESARSTSVHPPVTRRALTDVAHRVDQGDGYLERSVEEDTYRSARNAMGQYAFVKFVAEATPGTSAWVLGVVAAARDGSDGS